MGKYDISTTTIGDLLKDPQAVEIFDKHAPGLTSHPMIGMAKGMKAEKAMKMASGKIPQSRLDAIVSEISAL
ncbi:hypothetical protein ACF3NS_02425 [Arsenicicoccus cauae]|jgi:hypothetical protein|uniref:DUF1858 domain-containing protein n=2 Tax=Arsenicicoccus TaxID=267408 RepID=A0A6I3IQI0_9MICO|nr:MULTISPECIES: hypothetical protein [Arsenicicoccus]MCG7322313.1 hypothetical protein [Arsenicicoccus bolidensis]MTB70621.1 hypothetical protein [Arsenicicoccus cauae]